MRNIFTATLVSSLLFAISSFSFTVNIQNTKTSRWREFDVPEGKPYREWSHLITAQFGFGTLYYAGRIVSPDWDFDERTTNNQNNPFKFMPSPLPSSAQMLAMSDDLQYKEAERDLYFSFAEIRKAMEQNDWARSVRKMQSFLGFNPDAINNPIIRAMKEEIDLHK